MRRPTKVPTHERSVATVRRIHAASLLHDYAELAKLRVTSLIVMTAWWGYFFASRKAGVSSWNRGLFHALLGIGMVSSGAAALNEVMERDVDAYAAHGFPPAAKRPDEPLHAVLAGALLASGGSFYLAIFTNFLTGLLTFLTALVYLAAGSRGWMAVRGLSRVGNARLVRDLVPVAVPALFLDCAALPGRLCPGRSSHAACR